MAEEIFYKEYKIIGESYKNDSGKWIPRARIVPTEDSVNREERPLNWPEEFDNQLKADDFALESAQLYIDENY